MASRNYTTWALALGALVLIGVYYRFDPARAGFFPPCPLRAVTGWLCAGCGAQRAIHALLHGDLAAAWRLNPLLVVAFPYVAVGYVAERRAPASAFWARFRKTGYGQAAIWVICVVVVAWSVGRNL